MHANIVLIRGDVSIVPNRRVHANIVLIRGEVFFIFPNRGQVHANYCCL